MTAVHEKRLHDKLYGSERTGLTDMELCNTVNMTPSEWAHPERLQEKVGGLENGNGYSYFVCTFKGGV